MLHYNHFLDSVKDIYKYLYKKGSFYNVYNNCAHLIISPVEVSALLLFSTFTTCEPLLEKKMH